MEPRIKEFFNNVWSLWTTANNDQRIFLVSLVAVVAFVSFIQMMHFRWRIINRQEIKKVRHYAALKQVLSLEEKDAVRKLPDGIRPNSKSRITEGKSNSL